jgi:hypothetical protein
MASDQPREKLALLLYEDIAHPAAQHLGTALGKAVYMALTPVWLLSWGYDRMKQYLEDVASISDTISERLQFVPSERILQPALTIAGPALEALKYASRDADLRQMYANLLATSMDSATVRSAHPAFVEVIRQLVPDEARMVRLFAKESSPEFAKARVWSTDQHTVLAEREFSLVAYDAECAAPEFANSYLDNLRRLGLINISEVQTMRGGGIEFPSLQRHGAILQMISEVTSFPDVESVFVSSDMVELTAFGDQFCSACIRSVQQK